MLVSFCTDINQGKEGEGNEEALETDTEHTHVSLGVLKNEQRGIQGAPAIQNYRAEQSLTTYLPTTPNSHMM